MADTNIWHYITWQNSLYHARYMVEYYIPQADSLEN